MTVPVTVAVVSWNTRELLDRCLASLRPEADAGRAEVWVVDNASTDGSADLVRERHPWVKLVAEERNLGFGPAVNLVAHRTQSEWIAPANADIELFPRALEALLGAGARDPGAGAIAPSLVLPDDSIQHSVFPFPTLPFAAAFNLGLPRAVPRLGDRLCVPGRWDSSKARRVDWAIAAFEIVRRTAWDAAGGFDPGQWMYAEDLDLGWRLAEAGWPTRYEPAARVRHQSSASTAQAWGGERTERWMFSTYAWMLRRRGALRTRTYGVLNSAGAAVRWVPLALAARVRPARYAAARDDMRAWAHWHRVAGLASRARLEAHR